VGDLHLLFFASFLAHSAWGHFLPPGMKLGGDRTCSNSGRQRARIPLALPTLRSDMTPSNHTHPVPPRLGTPKNDVHDSLHFAEPHRVEPLPPVTSHVDLLGDCQGVVDLDAELAHCAFDLRMAQ
jgi:hypothetical protein